jgi:hypothetical protein
MPVAKTPRSGSRAKALSVRFERRQSSGPLGVIDARMSRVGTWLGVDLSLPVDDVQ